MTQAEPTQAPILLVLALSLEKGVVHISTEHDRPRAEIRANSAVSSGSYPLAWVVPADYQVAAPDDGRKFD
ncbi:MAG: hypothetical protein ACF8PG_07820 [Maioricimonas sp. JB045]|uniref:hypothetical protein n=1 Tax=Maioricimonas sp. JC845 TaxID=3232138 RepID=UPI0034575FC2